MLRYKKVIEVYCPLCGWTKTYTQESVDLFGVPKVCRACQDGESKVWKGSKDDLELPDSEVQKPKAS